jgi:octaprenyl-diphosphate synthase
MVSLKPLFEIVRDEMQEVGREFENIYRSSYAPLDSLLKYLLDYQGKRIRPALVFLAGRACGSLTPEHRKLAMLLELLHTATLIHDDIIDHADTRRNLESVNRKFGNETAVLLGDFLFAQAFTRAVDFGRREVRHAVSGLCRDVCIGEILEVSHRFDLDLSEEQYLDIIHKKTGLLFEVGCGLAAELAGASPDQAKALADYGRYLGMAFQIVDDCLDLVGEELSMGKSLGNDVTHGMTTLPIIHYYRSVPEETRERFREAFLAGPGPARDRAIQGFIEGSDSVAYAYAKAQDWTRTAGECLDRLRESPSREAMRILLDFVVQRIC